MVSATALPADANSRTQSFHPAYRPDIDGLRAVAILLVIIYHAFPMPLRGGFVGVDIFFVISGYLISSIIFKNLAQGNFSFVDFYARRIRRIFPALIIVLTCSLAFGWYALMGDEFKQLGKHAAGGVGFIDNFLLWSEDGYFNTASEQKPLMHLWSLGIEEQFYLFFPLLCWWLWRIRLNLALIIISLAGISFALNIFSIQSSAAAAFFLPQTRFWELLVGSALAFASIFPQQLVHARFRPIRSLSRLFDSTTTSPPALRKIKNWLSISGLFLLLLAALIIHKNKAFPGWWALLPVCGAAFLITAGPGAWANRKILSSRLMVFIGSISYPLYLWHWPILSFARIVDAELPPAPIRLLALACSFLCAWLTYQLLERPIRFRSQPPAWALTLCILATAIGCFGLIIVEQKGFPERRAHQDYAAQFDKIGNGQFLAYYAQFPPCAPATLQSRSERCRQTSRQEKPPTIAIIGDSHAEHLFSGIAAALPADENLAYLTKSCYPFSGLLERDACGGFSAIIDTLVTEPNLHTIILSGFWSYHLKENSIRLRDFPANRDGEDIFINALDQTLAQLQQSGKRIIFAFDIPDLDFEPSVCLPPRPFAISTRNSSDCVLDKSKPMARAKTYRDAAIRVLNKYPNVVRWDPVQQLCDQKSCRIAHDGLLLYRDRNHLSLAGSRWLAERLLATNQSLLKARPQ